jgi:hypothetical protein
MIADFCANLGENLGENLCQKRASDAGMIEHAQALLVHAEDK